MEIIQILIRKRTKIKKINVWRAPRIERGSQLKYYRFFCKAARVCAVVEVFLLLIILLISALSVRFFSLVSFLFSRMRRSFTAEFKLKVIQYKEIWGTSQASAKFDCSERMIRKWAINKQKLQGYERTRRTGAGPKAKWPELEAFLKDWVIEKRSKNRRVTTKDIQHEARTKAIEWDIDDFHGSDHWCQSFMKRNGFSVRRRTSVGQPLPSNYRDKIAAFRNFVKQHAYDIPHSQVVNFDEVPVPFDIVGGRTVDIKGKNEVSVDSTGKEKKNCTVVLGVTASGDKLKPMIIFKRKMMPKVTFPNEVVVKVNEKGWMTADVMKEWINECWLPKNAFPDNPEKSMLIYDSARCHRSAEQELKKVSKIAIIPGGLTKFLQPLDVSVNKPFKDRLKDLWENWMSDESKADYTVGGKRRSASLGQIAEWIKTAFYSISPETIMNGFDRAFLEEEVSDLETSLRSLNTIEENDEIELNTSFNEQYLEDDIQ